MADLFKMPKAGMFDAQGRLTPAGHRFLTGIETAVNSRTQGVAGTAEDVLTPSEKVIQTQGLWETMATEGQSGADIFTPDLGHRLDFQWTLTGVTTMAFPANIPAGAYPFFSVLFIQDGSGGRMLSMGSGYVGEAVEILDGANDMTLCGFKVLGAAAFTGWAIKGIEAAI